jgi:hypothetical protein
MLKRTVRNLAAAGVTIVSAAGLTALAATGASAATTSAAAPAHVTAQRSAADTACVDQTFGYSPDTYQPCVLDLQVLLNDLYRIGFTGPDQLLTTDGYYGIHTAGDVQSFNYNWIPQLAGSDEMGPFSWSALCELDWENGFHGAYWQAAGCTP